MPYEFFLELLYPLPLRHHRMFGVDAYYIKEKIVFALRKRENNPEDNGIWVASKLEHHAALKKQLNGLKAITTYGIKTWLVLPEHLDNFEEQANHLVDLIRQNSPLVGNIPKPRRKKSR